MLLTLAMAPGLALAGAAMSPLWLEIVAGLPVRHPDRLIVIGEYSDARGWVDAPASPANLHDWARHSRSLAELAFHRSGRGRQDDAAETLLEGMGLRQLVRVLAGSPNLMSVLGVPAAQGRTFVSSDSLPSSPRVAIVSYSLGRRLADGGSVIGRTIRLDDHEHLIVGQMPAGFYYPTPDVAVWIPIQIDPAEFLTRRQARIFRVIARLAETATLDQARADLTNVAAQLSRDFPATNGDTTVRIQLLPEWLTGPRAVPVRVAAVAGALILLIAFVNTALVTWMTDVATARDRALKRALGATPRRLALEAATVTVICSMAAVALAWPLAQGVVALAILALDGDAARSLALDWRALVVAGAVSTLGLCLVRVWLLLRTSTAMGAPVRMRWVTAVQAAVTVVLAVAAVSTLRGFATLASVPSGLPARDDVVTATMTLRGPRFREGAVVAATVREALERIRELPRVRHAGATAMLPLEGLGWTTFLWMPERGVANVEVRHREITDGYVEASGLPLVEGRTFSSVAGPERRELLVNQAFVRLVSAGRSPLGAAVTYGDPGTGARRVWTIVGVVGDERTDPRQEGHVPIVYQPHAVNPEETMTFVVQTAAPADEAVMSLRALLRDQDPAAVVLRAEPLRTALGRSVQRERATAQLGGAVALAALLLAGLGLYGVTTLDVARRRREYAIRAALGARRARVRWGAGVRALAPTLAGLLVGLYGAWLLPLPHLVATDIILGAVMVIASAGAATVSSLRRAGLMSLAELHRP